MPSLLRYDAAAWRSFARWGATRLPQWWLRYSPTPIGVVVGASLSTARAQILENLRLVHGTRAAVVEAFDVAATLANFGHCLAEGFAMSGGAPPPFRYTVERRDNLIRARDAGRGAILVTAHVGSWDVAGGVMSSRGFDLAMVMAPERDPRARAISDEARARVGVKVFHVGDDPLSALSLAQHVRGGGAIALQIDRVPPGMKARTGRLFHRPWSVPLGPFQLARVTGAPIVPVFTARLGFAQHLVCADAPITVPRRATVAELDRAIAAAMASVEGFIRRFPTQWFHFAPHPRVDRVHADLDDAPAKSA